MTTATTLQQIVQVSTALNVAEHPDAADQARQLILDWVEARSGLPITSDIRNGANAELGGAGSNYRLETLCDNKMWALRYEQSDELGRNWRADALITTTGLAPMLKTRLTCQREEKSEACPSVLPDFVFQAAKNVGLMDAGLHTGREPMILKKTSDVRELTELLKNPARKLPVIVISQMDRFQPSDANKDTGYLVDGKKLSLSMSGIAHVVMIPAILTWPLSDQLTRAYSVFNGGVRIYAPEVNPDIDHKSRHTLFTSEAIRATDSPKAFFNELIQHTYNQSVQSMGSQESVPSFTTIKGLFLRDSQKRNISAERDSWKQKYDESIEFAKSLEARALKAEEALQETTNDLERVLKLAAQLRLERDVALKASGQWKATAMEMGYPIPKSIAEVGEWAATHFSDRLEITNRAIHDAERCEFKDVPLFYRSLILLATHYYDATIRNDPAAGPLVDKEKTNLGVDIRKLFAQTKRPSKDVFIAQTASGSFPLNMALQAGRSSNPERLLRVRFCTDQKHKRILIGSFARPV